MADDGQVDWLSVCGVCCGSLDRKTAKLFPCLHTACCACIKSPLTQDGDLESNRMLLCPVCEEPFKADDACENFFIKVPSSEHVICMSCDEDVEAVSFCTECREWMCSPCTSAHKRVRMTKDHVICSPEEALKAEEENTVKTPVLKCTIHSEETLKLFCVSCGILTCRDCQLYNHKDHKYKLASEAFLELKEVLRDYISDLNSKVQSLMQQNTELDTYEKALSKSEEEIGLQTSNTIADVSLWALKRYKMLLAELNKICNPMTDRLEEHGRYVLEMKSRTVEYLQILEQVLASGDTSLLLCTKAFLVSNINEVLEEMPPDMNEAFNLNLSFANRLDDILYHIDKIGHLEINGQIIPEHIRSRHSDGRSEISSVSREIDGDGLAANTADGQNCIEKSPDKKQTSPTYSLKDGQVPPDNMHHVKDQLKKSSESQSIDEQAEQHSTNGTVDSGMNGQTYPDITHEKYTEGQSDASVINESNELLNTPAIPLSRIKQETIEQGCAETLEDASFYSGNENSDGNYQEPDLRCGTLYSENVDQPTQEMDYFCDTSPPPLKKIKMEVDRLYQSSSYQCSQRQPYLQSSDQFFQQQPDSVSESDAFPALNDHIKYEQPVLEEGVENVRREHGEFELSNEYVQPLQSPQQMLQSPIQDNAFSSRPVSAGDQQPHGYKSSEQYGLDLYSAQSRQVQSYIQKNYNQFLERYGDPAARQNPIQPPKLNHRSPQQPDENAYLRDADRRHLQQNQSLRLHYPPEQSPYPNPQQTMRLMPQTSKSTLHSLPPPSRQPNNHMSYDSIRTFLQQGQIPGNRVIPDLCESPRLQHPSQDMKWQAGSDQVSQARELHHSNVNSPLQSSPRHRVQQNHIPVPSSPQGHQTSSIQQQIPQRGHQTSNIQQQIPQRGHQTSIIQQQIPQRGHQTSNIQQQIPQRGHQTSNIQQQIPQTGYQTSNIPQQIPQKGHQTSNIQQQIPQRPYQTNISPQEIQTRRLNPNTQLQNSSQSHLRSDLNQWPFLPEQGHNSGATEIRCLQAGQQQQGSYMHPNPNSRPQLHPSIHMQSHQYPSYQLPSSRPLQHSAARAQPPQINPPDRKTSLSYSSMLVQSCKMFESDSQKVTSQPSVSRNQTTSLGTSHSVSMNSPSAGTIDNSNGAFLGHMSNDRSLAMNPRCFQQNTQMRIPMQNQCVRNSVDKSTTMSSTEQFMPRSSQFPFKRPAATSLNQPHLAITDSSQTGSAVRMNAYCIPNSQNNVVRNSTHQNPIPNKPLGSVPEMYSLQQFNLRPPHMINWINHDSGPRPSS